MPLLSNATVSTSRGGTTVLTNVRVEIVPPGKERFSSFGGVVYTVVNFDPGTNVAQGDILTLVSMDGHADVDQITKYKLENVTRVAGLLAKIRADVAGYFL